MQKSRSLWQLAGFILTAVAGTLLHFLYDWTGQSRFIALFSAVNESIWEHMKLLYFPMFVFALIESRYFSKEYEKFWCAKLVGFTVGLTLIPVLYYTYTGILGVSADWFNIMIFFLAAAAAFGLETKFMKNDCFCWLSPAVSFAVLFLIGLVFVVLTFAPPRIPFFQDPITKQYGIIIKE